MKDGRIYDIFVIGGGVNGCGIARDAVGRGLSVCLAEKSDIGSGTSSGSTKLIHGGLRYLEFYEFGLVRKSLIEREVLLRMAPHIIYPLRFVLPHHKGLRPAYLIRLGLLLYDFLGGRKLLPGSRTLDLTRHESGKPLKADYTKGFEYSDCWVDDARLVILNARDAAHRGASILPHTEVVSARCRNGVWTINTRNRSGSEQSCQAKILVNASGPWIDLVLENSIASENIESVRKVRGSHIVVPAIFENSQCYIFQNSDGRIVFAIPYQEDFTLIGTTEGEHSGDPGKAKITEQEIIYLCESVNQYFKSEVTPTDVVWSYSAIRPLMDDGETSARTVTRDYKIDIDSDDGDAPLINIYGGKITTYRKLAEDVMGEVARILPACGPSWTAASPLPGGDFPVDGYCQQVQELTRDFDFLGQRHCRRLVRQYGTEAWKILQNASSYAELGLCFGSDLYESEVLFQVKNEWATSAEDVLWRRTKEGLRLSQDQAEKLDDYLRKLFKQRKSLAV